MEMPKVTMMGREEFEERYVDADPERVGVIDSYEMDLLKRHGLDVPVVENLDAEILRAIEAGKKLNMAVWHAEMPDLVGEARERAEICGTTHCRAGFAVHLAGEAGVALELALGAESAGACIYFASTGNVPDFFATNEDAMADIRRCAGVEP